MKKYFCKTAEDTLKEFNVSKEGLSNEQAKKNLGSYGFNELNQKKKKVYFKYSSVNLRIY